MGGGEEETERDGYKNWLMEASWLGRASVRLVLKPPFLIRKHSPRRCFAFPLGSRSLADLSLPSSSIQNVGGTWSRRGEERGVDDGDGKGRATPLRRGALRGSYVNGRGLPRLVRRLDLVGRLWNWIVY